jgi:hypothetical protein
MKIKFTNADSSCFYESFSTKEEALIRVRALVKQTKAEGRLDYLAVLVKLYNQIQLM